MIPVSRLIPAKKIKNEREYGVMAHDERLLMPLGIGAYNKKQLSTEGF